MSEPQYVHQEDEVLLARVLRDSRPLLQRYGTSLIYALAAVVAAAAIYVYISRQPPATAEESKALLAASTPEQFSDLADTAAGTPIGDFARLREGELILRDALSNLFTNRKLGLEELDKAEKAFKKLDDSRDVSDEVRLKVLVGLARITEARCDGTDETVKAAVEAWDRILTSFPASKMFSELAESRKKKLETRETKDFYAWFQQQDPKPGEDVGLPQDGPGAVPGIPNIEDLLKPAETPANTTTPAPGAEGAAPAADGTPAQPATEQPATPEPAPAEPKAEQPATPEPAPAEPKAEQPATPEPAPAEPKAEQPATPEPAPAEPNAEQPTTPEKSGE